MITKAVLYLVALCVCSASVGPVTAQSANTIFERMDRQMQADFDRLDRQLNFFSTDGMLSRIGDRWFPVSGCREFTDRTRDDVVAFRTFAALGPDDQPVDLACILEDAGHTIEAVAVLTMEDMRDPRIFMKLRTLDGSEIVLENQGFVGGPARTKDAKTGEMTLNRISTYYRVWRWEDGAAFRYNTADMMEAMRLKSPILAAVLAAKPEAPLDLAFE